MLLALFLLCATSAWSAASMPLEVMGPEGVIETAVVRLPPGRAAGVTGLWCQVHNLSYPNATFPFTKASVKVNSGAWVPLVNERVRMPNLERKYGGVGGFYSTLRLTVPVSGKVLKDGPNTVSFRFDRTDGVSSGYRVLRLNFVDASGRLLVPETEFTYDDPASWTAPPGGDALHGETLWKTGVLRASPLKGANEIQARCTDCHAQDGRDLKYFNYSNKSIRIRSIFHGLSAKDGDDIAAYIRGLNAYRSTFARPWNPPYQPGPGLDQRPIEEWSAGAGIDSVLDSDQELVPYIFPGGKISAAALNPALNHNMREIPQPMQFLDWNHWLPTVHPKDSWADWDQNAGLTGYWKLRTWLAEGGAAPKASPADLVEHWKVWVRDVVAYRGGKVLQVDGISGWNRDISRRVYSAAQWSMVKAWELMTEFKLENRGPQIFAPQGPGIGEARGWWTDMAFRVSLRFLHMPRDDRAIIDGRYSLFLSDFWYRIQLVLYGHRWTGGTFIDWTEVWAFIRSTGVASDEPVVMQLLLHMAKGAEMSVNGYGPDSKFGWEPVDHPDAANFALETVDADLLWSKTPRDVRRRVSEALLDAWMTKTLQYPTTSYWTDPRIDPSQLPVTSRRSEDVHDKLHARHVYRGVDDAQVPLADKLWSMIPRNRSFGVDERLLALYTDWARRLFPRGAWDQLKTATAAPHMEFKMPHEGDIFPFPATVRVAGSTEGLASKKLSVYANGRKVAVAKATGAPGQFAATLGDVPAGTYTLYLQSDFADGSVRTPPHTITVGGPPVSTTTREAVASWEFLEGRGNRISDSAGYGNDAKLIGGVIWSTAAAGGSVFFDGVNGHMESAFQFTTPNPWTLSARFKTRTRQGGAIVALSPAISIAIYMTDEGLVALHTIDRKGINFEAVSTAPYNDDAWHRVDGVVGDRGIELFIDGAFAARNDGIKQDLLWPELGGWQVGHANLNGTPKPPSSFYFEGSIDDVRIYSRALSSLEIASRFKSWKKSPAVQAGSAGQGAVASAASTSSATSPAAITVVPVDVLAGRSSALDRQSWGRLGPEYQMTSTGSAVLEFDASLVPAGLDAGSIRAARFNPAKGEWEPGEISSRTANSLNIFVPRPGIYAAVIPMPTDHGQPKLRALLDTAHDARAVRLRAAIGPVTEGMITIFDGSGMPVHVAAIGGLPLGVENGHYYYEISWSGARANENYFAMVTAHTVPGATIKASAQFRGKD
jgi:hypothetical protein